MLAATELEQAGSDKTGENGAREGAGAGSTADCTSSAGMVGLEGRMHMGGCCAGGEVRQPEVSSLGPRVGGGSGGELLWGHSLNTG